jgi:hypothetical protein
MAEKLYAVSVLLLDKYHHVIVSEGEDLHRENFGEEKRKLLCIKH